MRVMVTFLEYYHTLMGFVLFKLFRSIGLRYPPELDAKKEKDAEGLDALLLQQEKLQLPSSETQNKTKSVQNVS